MTSTIYVFFKPHTLGTHEYAYGHADLTDNVQGEVTVNRCV